MSTLSGAVGLFLKQESGLETVEYSIITAMIATAIVIALGALILAIGDLYESVAEVL